MTPPDSKNTTDFVTAPLQFYTVDTTTYRRKLSQGKKHFCLVRFKTKMAEHSSEIKINPRLFPFYKSNIILGRIDLYFI